MPPTAPVLQAGVPVTFTAPSACASGTFLTGGTNSTTVNTTASGIATASFFTANGIAGTYTVTATTAGLPVGHVHGDQQRHVGSLCSGHRNRHRG